MFVPLVMLVRQARGQGRQARGPQAPAAGSPENCAALDFRHLSLSELVDHVLRRMSPLRHLSPFLRPNSNMSAGPVLGGWSEEGLERGANLSQAGNIKLGELGESGVVGYGEVLDG